MTRQRTIQVIALIGLLICVSGAAVLMAPINEQRKELQLDMGLENTISAVPPNIILETAALGSFRGLLVDFLWYRVNQLKEEGKFYEINTLAQFITTLQPRFPQVWAFHAWNMAYNISVTTNTPQERWSWVSNGIRLLRDQGIVYNPRSVRLYRELSWIYFHKIGQMSDDMHWYYKAQVARNWEEILGVPNPDATTKEVVARFKLVADALPSLREVRASSPEAAQLVDKLTGMGIKLDEAFLRRIDRLLMFSYSQDARLLGMDLRDLPEKLGIKPQVVALMQNPKYNKAFITLMSHLRKRVIIDHYHMKPQKMLSLMEEFGPIDWRHPAAHGEYWASLGVDVTDELRDPTSSDLLNTYRQKLHSFQDLTRSGRIVFDPVTGTIDMLPDPRFIPAYDKAFTDAIKMADRTKQKMVEESYGPGHENFLLMATVYMYLYGDQAEAQKYFLRAKKRYGDTEYNKHTGRYNDTIEELVFDQFKDIRDMTSSVRQFIDAMVLNGITKGLVNYNPGTFSRFLKIAKTGYDKYNTNKVVNPLATQNRLSLPPFGELVVGSYVSYMQSGNVSALAKARVWSNTPPVIKQHAYTQLREILDNQAKQSGLDPARAFPPPDGWTPPDNAKAKPIAPPDHAEDGVHVQRK